MSCGCDDRSIYDANGESVLVWNNYANPIALGTSPRAAGQLVGTKIEISCAVGLNGGQAVLTDVVLTELAANAGDLKKKALSLLFLADEGYNPADYAAWSCATAGMFADDGNELCCRVDFVGADYVTLDKSATCERHGVNLGRLFNKRTAGNSTSVWLYVLYNDASGVSYVSSDLRIALCARRC